MQRGRLLDSLAGPNPLRTVGFKAVGYGIFLMHAPLGHNPAQVNYPDLYNRLTSRQRRARAVRLIQLQSDICIATFFDFR